MVVPDLVNLSALIDDAKCFALVRQHRWPEGVHCPACGSGTVVRDGFDETQAHRQRYRCKACTGRRLRMLWSSTGRSRPSSCRTEPISPSVWRSAKRNTVRSVSADRGTRSEEHTSELQSRP